MDESVQRTVLAVTTSYPLRPSSWAGIFIQRLYENLPSQVVVVCPADDRPASFVRSGRLSVYPVKYAPKYARGLAQQSGGVVPGIRRRPWRALIIPLLLGSLIWRTFVESRKADLIHANWAVCGAIAVLVGRVRRLPVVTTLRGDDVKRAARSLIDKWLLKFAVSGSHQIVCVSEAMAADLRVYAPAHASKISVVRNGVDQDFLLVKRAASASDVVRIGAAGSLISRKGFDILLAAIALMKERSRIRLSIVGDGPERPRLEKQMLHLGIADQVVFLGEIPPDRMPTFFADIDVFVLPSRSEGRPNVVIEALAAGLSVVSTDLPGVAGLVESGSSGWLVEHENPQAMASALDEACSDPVRRSIMGEAGREKMRRDGGWARTAGEYQCIFDKVADAYRGGE